MKTYNEWQHKEIDLDIYMPEPCEIDEDMFYFLIDIVSAEYQHYNIVQCGEAHYKINEVFYYRTLSNIGDKWFNLGILPRFKNPKL